MFPSGHKDPDASSEERSPSASFSRDKDLEMERSKGGSSDGLICAKPPNAEGRAQVSLKHPPPSSPLIPRIVRQPDLPKCLKDLP